MKTRKASENQWIHQPQILSETDEVESTLDISVVNDINRIAPVIDIVTLNDRNNKTTESKK